MLILDLISKATGALTGIKPIKRDYTLLIDPLNTALIATITRDDNVAVNNHTFTMELDSSTKISFLLCEFEMAYDSHVFTIMDLELVIDGKRYNTFINKYRSIEDYPVREDELKILAAMDGLIARLQALV